MTPSLLRSKKETCLCSGVSSPLYTSAMEEEEDPSTSTTRSLLPVSAAALPAMEVAGGRDHATTTTTTKDERRREGSVRKLEEPCLGGKRKELGTEMLQLQAPLKAVWCVSDVAGDREDGVERNRGQFRFRSVETDAVCGCVGGVAWREEVGVICMNAAAPAVLRCACTALPLPARNAKRNQSTPGFVSRGSRPCCSSRSKLVVGDRGC